MPNKVVYKFPSPHRDGPIQVSEGAQIVLVDHQDGVPTVWVEVDLDAPIEFWFIHSVATGERNRIQENWEHIGSVAISSGTHRDLVWHLYKENN